MNIYSDIKVLVWDFDGTLYRPNPELFAAVREAEYRTVMDHTGWTEERTIKEFHLLYKKTIQSATATAAHLAGISIATAAVEMEQYFDRRDFLKRDEELIAMFQKLYGYRHIILANGVIARHKETLEVLGIPANTFEVYVTSEIVGVTKPGEKGFQYVLDHTALPPNQHLMIGDRIAVDLEPAKKLGMMTCLVHSTSKPRDIDILLDTVYELPMRLGE